MRSRPISTKARCPLPVLVLVWTSQRPARPSYLISGEIILSAVMRSYQSHDHYLIRYSAILSPCLDRDHLIAAGLSYLSTTSYLIRAVLRDAYLILSPPTALSYQVQSHLIINGVILSASTERSLSDYLIYPTMSYLIRGVPQATLSYHARSHLINSILSASYRDYLISREAILSSSYQRDCRDYKAILSSAAVSYQHRDAILSADIHDSGATESILSAAEPSHHQASDPQQSSYLASQ